MLNIYSVNCESVFYTDKEFGSDPKVHNGYSTQDVIVKKSRTAASCGKIRAASFLHNSISLQLILKS